MLQCRGVVQERPRDKAAADPTPGRPPEKRAAKPVHTVGLNLGLRLYLLLLAIFLPAFFLFYVGALRSVESLHAAEVTDVLRRVSLRVEDWLVSAAGLVVAPVFRYAVRRPLSQLTEAMEGAADGDLSALAAVRVGEFGGLAASYNQMMRRLKQSMDQSRGLLEQIRSLNAELQGRI